MQTLSKNSMASWAIVILVLITVYHIGGPIALKVGIATVFAVFFGYYLATKNKAAKPPVS